MKNNKWLFPIILLIGTLIYLTLSKVQLPGEGFSTFGSDTVRAEVTQIIEEGKVEMGGRTQPYQIARVKILEGKYAGIEMEIDYGKRQIRSDEYSLELGEKVLVAISKTHPAEAVRAAFAAGVRDFGENRVQEAEPKIAATADLRESGLRWHLVGHLQSNKARRAAALFEVVQSLDSLDLALRLARFGAEAARPVRALVQVDLAGEEAKFGLPEAGLLAALGQLRGKEGLRIEGLMVLPPYFEDPERARPYFRRLRSLHDRAQVAGLLEGRELSMGMSHDFEAAVEEGATIVRVGTAIFGERQAAA